MSSPLSDAARRQMAASGMSSEAIEAVSRSENSPVASRYIEAGITDTDDMAYLAINGVTGFSAKKFADCGISDAAEMVRLYSAGISARTAFQLRVAGVSLVDIPRVAHQCDISGVGAEHLISWQQEVLYVYPVLGPRLLNFWAAPTRTFSLLKSDPSLEELFRQATDDVLSSAIALCEEYGFTAEELAAVLESLS